MPSDTEPGDGESRTVSGVGAHGVERSPVARAALAIDEIIYSVERLMIAVFLIAATVTVAIDFGNGLLKRNYSDRVAPRSCPGCRS